MRRFSVFSILIIALSIPAKNAISQINIDSLQITGGLNALQVAASFLTIAPDSRSGAMGDVGGATSPDVNSQHWNAAKYPFIEGKQYGIAFSYTPWLKNLANDISLSYLTGYYCIDKNQTISASLLYFSLGEIIFTNNAGGFVKQFTPHEMSLDVGYSRKFSDKFAGGLVFRYIRSDLTGGYSNDQTVTSAGQSFAADLAAYFQTPIQNGEYALGISITNLGAKMSYSDDVNKDFLPTNLRIGNRATLNMDQYNSFSLSVDLNKLLVPTPPKYYTDEHGNQHIIGKDPNVSIMQGVFQSFNDAPNGGTEELQEIQISTGIEYWYAKQFAVRGGYFYEHKNKGNRKYFTVGAGLRYNVFTLDFAYLIPTNGFNSPMANTVRFSLALDFDTQQAGKKKK